MKRDKQDNETFAPLGLAALRVLAKIKEPEEKITREHHEAREEQEDKERERECDPRNPVVIVERKRSA